MVEHRRNIMELISREELKAKLDRGDDFKLVMVMHEWAYRAQHIPGSENARRVVDTATYDKDDEIVVYCSGSVCIASHTAYAFLVNEGYTNVRRYAGGLEDWATAGYPLEGKQVS
jgi:rhodanese-related sulfurtransferase